MSREELMEITKVMIKADFADWAIKLAEELRSLGGITSEDYMVVVEMVGYAQLQSCKGWSKSIGKIIDEMNKKRPSRRNDTGKQKIIESIVVESSKETGGCICDYVVGDIEFVEHEGSICAKYLNTYLSRKLMPTERIIRIYKED